MNWDRIEGNWKQFSGKVQQQWGKLTNDDLDVIDGRREELSGRIQKAYGVTKDEADRQITNFADTLGDDRATTRRPS
ncbi:MAG TPA: CsbD family protein [Steroidobacteraceae bacterium]|nr:CsbD family protein [Steroidobacteraceae bacterium]